MMFQTKRKQGTSAYYEFQFCKHFLPPEILVTPEYYGKIHFHPDSLLVHMDDDEIFFSNYLKYLSPALAPDGTTQFSDCGVNYYTKEQAEGMRSLILSEKPLEYGILAAWLEKAASEYNGFYILGI